MRKLWYFFPLFCVSFGIYGALLPLKISQKGFLLAFLICGLCLIVQSAIIKKEAGRQEKWFDYFFPVLFCVFIWILGLLWEKEGTELAIFTLTGVMLGKVCMLATYLSFRWFHMILYGLFAQMIWEFTHVMKWVELSPLIRIFT